MSEHRNLTVALKPSVIQKAKKVAASRETSVSRLVADLIERLAAEDEQYEAARREAEKYLREGYSLGGRISALREELHER